VLVTKEIKVVVPDFIFSIEIFAKTELVPNPIDAIRLIMIPDKSKIL
tara:strand:+ start:145 stop:285 length:141 start_codon:yes stop_codon:yes gene_type:complete